MGGEISAQGDVYSYGILLLEMFTGKRPTDNMFTDAFGLHSYVKMASAHKLMDIVDPKLSVEESSKTSKTREGCTIKTEELYLSIFHIAVSCAAEMPRDRMDINDALCKLQAIRNNLAQVATDN